jgi:DNA-binding NarL/FixJ family response regulator
VLIADDGPREAIAEIIRAQGLQTVVLNGIGDLPGEQRHEDFSVAVIWLQDTTSSLGGSLRALTRRFGDTPLVVVCAAIQRWGVRAALNAGVAGVVLVEQLDSALAPCLRAVQTGQTCVPRAHCEQIEPPALSSREKQILGLVVMGYMNSQIAEQLFLAESTVKSHLSSAFGKLGVRSRHEAVKLIIDPDGGLGLGILGLGGERIEPVVTVAP